MTAIAMVAVAGDFDGFSRFFLKRLAFCATV
jgi:hypothetical protein